MAMARAERVVVVGGGIAGLAAAFALSAEPGVELTLIEAEARLGGKIATVELAGVPVEAGPDSFLARRPEAVALAKEAGFGEDLVEPATGEASLWSRGRRRRLPDGLVLGVPTDLGALARSGVLGDGGVGAMAVARAAVDLALPASAVPEGDDIAVGTLVRARMGHAVARKLVDPLVGGINAGDTEQLSAAVVAPAILDASRRGSLIRGLRAPTGPVATAGRRAEPLFLTIRQGLSRLVAGLGTQLAQRGACIVTGERVTGLERAAAGYAVRTSGGRTFDARAVVVALPAGPAAALVSALAPVAGAEIGRFSAASVCLLTLAYRSAALAGVSAGAPAGVSAGAPAGVDPLAGSGFLVDRDDGRLLTACSFVGCKWPHLAVPGLVLLRASCGWVGDERPLAMDDEELVAAVHAELSGALGLREPPVEAGVHRWPASFPQYAVGHLDGVARIEADLRARAPGVVLAGAAYRGVGIATCVATGFDAAADVRRFLAGAVPPGRR